MEVKPLLIRFDGRPPTPLFKSGLRIITTEHSGKEILFMIKNTIKPIDCDADGNTLLHAKIIHGQALPVTVKKLLNAGFDPTAKNTAGKTPEDILHEKLDATTKFSRQYWILRRYQRVINNYNKPFFCCFRSKEK